MQIEWHDLLHLAPRERLVELLRPVPWLAASLGLAYAGWYPLALAGSFLFSARSGTG